MQNLFSAGPTKHFQLLWNVLKVFYYYLPFPYLYGDQNWADRTKVRFVFLFLLNLISSSKISSLSAATAVANAIVSACQKSRKFSICKKLKKLERERKNWTAVGTDCEMYTRTLKGGRQCICCLVLSTRLDCAAKNGRQCQALSIKTF